MTRTDAYRPMLEVTDLTAGYGGVPVLFGMTFSVRRGEVVTLMGRNGMGKTTTLRAVMGLLQPTGGSVLIDGTAMQGRPAHAIARCGIGLVPEGRQIFPTLSVTENLIATAANRAGSDTPRWTLDAVLALFPRLGERRDQGGGSLSGGEQQMLAIGRALMTNPRLLILDEATEGLAPLIREEIWRVLASLKAEGQSILVIDKNVSALLALADHHTVVEKGRVVWQSDTEAFRADGAVIDRYLHV